MATAGKQMAMVAQDELGRPVIIIRDQPKKVRATGLEAHKANIAAARAIANVIKTSFGPKGMDKMLISKDHDLTITNDGATILQEMDITHPIGQLLVELSQCQDNEIGDGTTGVVLLACALLEKAEKLLDQGIHPIQICNGYDVGAKIAVDHLSKISRTIDIVKMNEEGKLVFNKEVLVQVAETALNSKIVSKHRRRLAETVVEAVTRVAVVDKEQENKFQIRDVNLEHIKLRGRTGGGSIGETCLFSGVLLDKPFAHPGMSDGTKELANDDINERLSTHEAGNTTTTTIITTRAVYNPNVCLFACALEPPKTKTNTEIIITSGEQYHEMYEYEQNYFREVIKCLDGPEDAEKDENGKSKNHVDVVFCQFGFDDEATHLLNSTGRTAVRWVMGEDMETLAVMLNGRILQRPQELLTSPSPLKICKAKCVREISLGTTGEKMTVIEPYDDTDLKETDNVIEDSEKRHEGPQVCTILVRGPSTTLVEEAKRSIWDAMCVVRSVLMSSGDKNKDKHNTNTENAVSNDSDNETNNKGENICTGHIVYGGGACELACACEVTRRASEESTLPLASREELFPVLEFCNALVTIPSQIASNCGLDPIMTTSQMREEYNKRFESGSVSGFDVGVDYLSPTGVGSMKDRCVFESLASKQQQILLATQVVRMVLRIDELIEDAIE